MPTVDTPTSYPEEEDNSLIQDLQALSANLATIDDAKTLPEALGYRVLVEAVGPSELLKTYDRTRKYRDCRTLKRMIGNGGSPAERLQDISREILGRRNYRMKLSKRSRRRYNRDVDDLADVVGDAQKFKANHVLSYKEPEGAGILGFVAGAAGYWAFSYFVPDSAIPQTLSGYLLQTSAVVGIANGVLTSVLVYKSKHNQTELRKEISYVNKFFGRDDSD